MSASGGIRPCLRQIYVAPQQRNKGYATIIGRDFLKSRDRVLIESPNDNMMCLLRKMGLVDEEGTSTGRVSFITCM
jgi:predicted GNAT family N-acyltransferase